ncbi:MAG: hypothetical protein ACQXXH_03545 [Candidatus Bathyarchaeia archaeon]|nr:hypothetical protein [Candidatus Bathyarchaeota archaeon A05DMB-4]MDH7594813.1 hypothetical protein [Candidatus Bathyarchaeota archaeon]
MLDNIPRRKKTSEIAADMTQATIRKVGLAQGLVDYKVCSIDQHGRNYSHNANQESAKRRVN